MVISMARRTLKVSPKDQKWSPAVILKQDESINWARQLVLIDVWSVLQRSRPNVNTNLRAQLYFPDVLISVAPDRVHMPLDAPTILPDVRLLPLS